jgi:hypothetical protein
MIPNYFYSLKDMISHSFSMKKISLILCLLLSQLSFAQDNNTGDVSDNNTATQTNQVRQDDAIAHAPTTETLDNQDKDNYYANLPNELKPWFNWYQTRFSQYCPNNNEAHCVFASALNIQLDKTNSNQIHYELKGYSFNQNQTLILPHTQNNMPFDVNIKGMKGVKLILNQSDLNPTIILPKGEFDIEANLNIGQEDLWVGNVATIHDNRNISTKLEGEYLKSITNQSTESNVDNKNQDNDFQVQTFRILSADVPERLNTIIRVISPKTQTIDLGEVLPKGFIVSQISSTQKVEFSNNHYYLWANSGVNYIDIASFSQNAIASIDISHLINHEAQEFWSFANGVRNFKTDSYTSIDSTRLELPPLFLQSPSQNFKSLFQMKLDEPIVITYNEEVKPTQNIVVERDLYKISHDNNFIFKDSLNLDTLSPTFYSTYYDIKAIKGDSGNLIVLKNRDNLEGFYPNTKHTEVDGLTQNYQDLSLEHATYTNVNVHLPPRYRLLTVFGASSPNSYIGSFTLYSLFALFFIVIASYKLFNWKVALIAAISILGFTQTTIFIWFFWFSLLFIVGLMNRLEKEGKLHKALRVIALASIAIMSLNVAYFTVYETQKVFNPIMDLDSFKAGGIDLSNITGSPTMARYNKAQVSDEAVPPPAMAPAPSTINSLALSSTRSYSPLDKEPNLPKPNVEISNEKKSLFIDNWDTLDSLSINYNLSNVDNHFKLIYASSFWVNLMGIIQIITIWLMLFVFSYKFIYHFFQVEHGSKYYKMLTQIGRVK